MIEWLYFITALFLYLRLISVVACGGARLRELPQAPEHRRYNTSFLKKIPSCLIGGNKCTFVQLQKYNFKKQFEPNLILIIW